MRDTIFILILVAGLAVVATANADINEEAMAAFKEGKELFNAGEFARASDAFRKANNLKPNWKLLYNIGQCEAAAKRHGLALEAFEAYLSQGGDDIPEGRQVEVSEEVKRLRGMVGEVEVNAPDGAAVVVDGVERDKAPLPGPLMVAAGVTHQILVKLGDEVLLDRSIKVSSSKTVTVEVEAGPQPAVAAGEEEEKADEAEPETAPVADEPETKKNKLRMWGWITTGLGAAVLAGSAVTGGMALAKSKDLDGNCDDAGCPEDYWDSNDTMNTLGTTTDVLIGVGSAVTVAGVVMLIVSATSDEGDEGDVALIPVGAPGFVGASAEWRF